MTTQISFLSGRQITNNSGVPQAGARVYHYRAGTTTALTVWQNSGATVAHTTPYVECDAGGFVPLIYVDDTYDWKAVIRTAADATLQTYDNLPKAGIAASQITGRIALHALIVEDKDATSPPGSPVDGDRYIVASGAAGAWASQDGNVAEYVSASSSWSFSAPEEGWLAWVADEDLLYRHTGSAWVVDEVSHADLGLLTANGARLQLRALSQSTTLSGATTDAATALPIGLILGVSTRVTTLITASGGGASFSVGDGTTAGKFGSSLGFTAGSTNRGHIGPTGYYSGTDPLRYTVNTGAFTAGVVRSVVWYMEFTPPTS